MNQTIKFVGPSMFLNNSNNDLIEVEVFELVNLEKML